MRIIQLLPLLLLSACTAADVPPAASGADSAAMMLQCSKDTDCKGDRICESGACRAPATKDASSSESNQAGSNQADADTAANGATEGARTSEEYKEAYACALEGLTSDVGSGGAAHCVGNARDPSDTELQAYDDAERDVAKQTNVRSGSCTFSHAVWIAEGSRADEFAEGEQEEHKLRRIAHLLPSREDRMRFFDGAGKPVPMEVAKRWFTETKTEHGSSYRVSDQALKTCSKAQLG